MSMAKLEALLEEMSRVVAVSHSIGSKEGESQIHELFTENKDGVLVPLEKQIRITDDKAVKVPTYTIRHLSGIALSELNIELETDVDIEEKDGKITMYTAVKSRNPLSRRNHISIQWKYNMTEIAEGLHLLRDKFNAKLANALSRITT